MTKALKLLPRCKGCGTTFKTEREFQNHDCVRALEDVPMEQLMAMYEARQKKPQ
jgi:hypothetical protein